MVLCKTDKYYNQVKFQVLWPRLKVGSIALQLEFGNFLDSNRIARKHQNDCLRGSICRSELT